MTKRIVVRIMLLLGLVTGSLAVWAQDDRLRPPPVSNKWLEILDREVKANGGRIPIDPQISVAVDHEGSGAEYSELATERENAYGQAFVKLRSLATYLYRTGEGRAAYLELFNPDFLTRLAERLDFDLSHHRRVNLRDRKFTPLDLPVLLEYILHNMTYVLNLEPDFTRTYNAFSSEDDTTGCAVYRGLCRVPQGAAPANPPPVADSHHSGRDIATAHSNCA